MRPAAASNQRLAARLCITFAILALAVSARAATIEQATLLTAGGAVEVHFHIHGQVPRWYVSGHGEELWIDLQQIGIVNPGRTLYAAGQFPVTRVSLNDLGSGHARLVITVNGKVDYAVAHLRHELVVRIAPAGKLPDLARPLFTEMAQGRPSSLTVAAGYRPVADETRPVAGYRRAPAAQLAPKRPLEDNSARTMAGGAKAERGHNQSLAAVRAGDSVPALRPVAIAPESHNHDGRPLVVIDAGHGGYDPGTASAGGIEEKNVALAIASRLAAALEARGVSVELTRDGDRFLSLAERTAVANTARADLFVSIHLNSSPSESTSGIETYYLNNTTDRATIRLARMENGGAAGYGAVAEPNLNYILTNLRQDYKANESAALARMIEAESAASVEASLGVSVNALGAKQGPFYVLVGAEMPAVLIECGFLSNPQEARTLTEAPYQEALASGIAAAVVHYFNADAAVGNL